MPYLTLTLRENLKLQLSPGLVASYDIQPRNGVRLFYSDTANTKILQLNGLHIKDPFTT